MKQQTRIIVALIILVVLVVAIIGLESLRGQTLNESDLPPGSIPIYLDGKLVAGFAPADLAELTEASFVDAEEGKTQQGWLLRDVLLLDLKEKQFEPASRIIVSSTSREKSVTLSWAEVDNPANSVMFDLSGRGTLKLVSLLERLDVRDEWVQDVDRIEITTR